jgi:hypothetical protein
MDGMRRRSPLISNLAWILDREGHNAEAKKLDREELDIQRRVFKTDDQETAVMMNNLAATLRHEGRYADAEKLQRETLDIQRRLLGLEHPDMLRSMNNLANTPAHESHDGEAEQLQSEALVIKQPVLVIDCDRLLELGAWHPWRSRNCDLRAVSGEDFWLEGRS